MTAGMRAPSRLRWVARTGTAAVREVDALGPLTQTLVATLNSELSLADLAGDVAEIGYPTA